MLTGHRNAGTLEALVAQWRPALAVLSNGEVRDRSDGGTRWRGGAEALIEAVERDDVDVVINALVGAAGLAPTLAALRAGKRVALANKESLVCAGSLVLEAARSGGGELIPVDSEHSAILQCLTGRAPKEVERLLLTASGGPFRCTPNEQLATIRPADALKHPTWDMGAKITIDSATLANKALEIIEAHFLFGLGYERIGAVVHPQSIIHSMVEFVDGSVLSQMGCPTMELPVLYALTHPERLPYPARRYDPVETGALTFEAVREDAFPAFGLGVEAGRRGGGYPAVYNAANEVAVAAFLRERLSFPGIGAAIEHALEHWEAAEVPDLDAVLAADRWARQITNQFIEENGLC